MEQVHDSMIPGRTLSSQAVPAPYLKPDDLITSPIVDYERGGVALRDGSQGLNVRDWIFRLVGDDVTVEADGVPRVTLFSAPGATEISGAFDQNMNPAVGFMQAGEMRLYWYDTTVERQVTTTFSGHSPRVCMDDKRSFQTLVGGNDVIFAYMRDGSLYFRAQRDRYTVETKLADIGEDFIFKKVGMNSINRLQFEFEPIPRTT